MLSITNPYQPASDEQVTTFERRIGAKLPEDFRSFLLLHNGGKPNPKRFSTSDGKIESMVSIFFPLSGETDETLVAEYEKFTLRDQLPPNLLSIAKDPTDNRITIAFQGDDVGAVYYWSCDEEPAPASRSYAYLRKIADRFSDFAAKLHL